MNKRIKAKILLIFTALFHNNPAWVQQQAALSTTCRHPN